jgi:hypothetical protein
MGSTTGPCGGSCISGCDAHAATRTRRAAAFDRRLPRPRIRDIEVLTAAAGVTPGQAPDPFQAVLPPHALVGDTSKGRKGTSHDTPQAIVQAAAADSDWDRRVQGGLASGEGVIWAVRDPIEETRKGEHQHQ